MADTYQGRCFCGAVRFTVTGSSAVQGYCHCDSCREWAGAPVTAVSLWPGESLQITQGEEFLASYNKTPANHRYFCKKCGGHVFGRDGESGMVDVLPSAIAGFVFQPAFHVHYGETKLRIRDGLPKFKDLPKDFGGSGELLPE